jgi:two-component system cell cycle sensor histidine kinase/response regulator CckA
MSAAPVATYPSLLARIRPASDPHRFTPVEVQELMQGIYARGDRLMVGFLAAHFGLALLLAWYHQTWVATLLVGGVSLGGFWLLARLIPRTFFTRSMAGIAQQAFVALHIYQMHGQPEQHFWFFTAFTMMIVYQDWRCMWPGTVLIIAQHTVFAWLHNAGYPVHFFPEQHVGFTKLLFHYGIAIVHVILCGYWAHLLKEETLEDAWQRLRLAQAGERVEEQLVRVRTSEQALQATTAALQESSRRQRAILDNIADLAWVKDKEGRYVAVNRAYAAAMGRTPEAIMGCTDEDLFPADLARAHHDGDTRVLSNGGRVRLEEEFIDRKGQRLRFEVIKTAILDDSGELRGTTGIARDISERTRAEEARRRLEAKVLQSQKLESLGVLAGGLAHDFNNLLVGIMGNAGVARSELAPESPAQETLERIEAAALRAADLTRQMLAYSGKGRFIIERVDLTRAVQEMTHLLGAVISKKAALRLNLADRLPAIEADPTQVRQVLMNLITNASDALGDRDGVIGLTTGRIEADRDYLDTFEADSGAVPGTYVYLEVTDSGAGMDAETLKRIFDPFFTTKFTGRGLGLAAVLGIVRGHHGAIRVYSEVGRGTTFKVLLPAIDGAADQPAAPQNRLSAIRGHGNVLVVDDEEVVRDVAKRVLTLVGFTVEIARDGEQAIEMVRPDPARFNCVVLDMMMPRRSGEETFRELRTIAPGLPVLLSSGYNEQDATRDFVGKGLAGFVQKPYRPDELIEAVQRVIEQTAPQRG